MMSTNFQFSEMSSFRLGDATNIIFHSYQYHDILTILLQYKIKCFNNMTEWKHYTKEQQEQSVTA